MAFPRTEAHSQLPRSGFQMRQIFIMPQPNPLKTKEIEGFKGHKRIYWHKMCINRHQPTDTNMNYEIPAGTARLLKQSREIAKRYHLLKTSSLCLLFSVLDDGLVVTSALKQLGIGIESLIKRIEESLSRQEHASEEQALPAESELPEFDANCMRIVKLLALEDRLANGKHPSDLLLVLSILHDRNNEAKALLHEMNVSYGTLLQQAKPNEVKSDYNFPDEEDSPYPNDDHAKNDTPAMQKEPGKKASSDTPIIDNFGTDLTAIATKGGLDPVVGRETEIQRIVQILCRRKKNNPIIIGEPGVGKSAIVEGLADRIAHHKVPHLLANKRIVTLDMATIVAGTQYRGQFEERLRRLIQELKSHPEVILFIDEIHTIIGAGSTPGSLDAANILKPALARGEVQCIGATTTGEFKKTIEKDGALDRRFQKILIEPTSPEESLIILSNIKERYEKHHNVTYTPEALKACVEFTTRYVTDRTLPDKAIDALDEAGARMHLAGAGTPKLIEDKEKEIEQLRTAKFKAAQNQNYELAANLRDQVQKLSIELENMTLEWQNKQKETPSEVDEAAVAEVVSMMSGVPITRIASKESERLKGMRDELNSRVIAQEKAVERLTRAITRSRIGLKGSDRPIGTFLFVGPTGVGKTHLVKCLAEWMFGSKDALIRIDMSEYGEKYSVSRLLGAPPGYVGYEEGGQLTERVRRHPYSVILLDEIEKAHPDVFNTLLQVMDEGRLTDGNGTTVDFRNTIIVLTSNSGSRQLKDFGRGLGFEHTNNDISNDMAESIVLKVLRKQFAPEFLNRIDDIIMFNPLNKESAALIAGLEFNELLKRMSANKFTLHITDEARGFVVEKGFDAQYGARSLKRAIQHHIEDALCDYIMEHPAENSFTVGLKDGRIEVKNNPA